MRGLIWQRSSSAQTCPEGCTSCLTNVLVWPSKFHYIIEIYIMLYTTHWKHLNIYFWKRQYSAVFYVWAQQQLLCAIVICPVQTNNTSNSIPSVIKGYLDRNINISLKLNQMLLHGGVQDSEEGERKTEKQGRHFTQESESVPRPRHFETFISEFLLPPSPWPLPPNPEQGDIPEETGEKSHPAWVWLSATSHMRPWEACQRGDSATARTG